MRQIEMMVSFIARIFFKKDIYDDNTKEDFIFSQSDPLFIKIKELLLNHKICEAEDLLFESVDSENSEHLKIALYFYRELNLLSDEELEKYNFSREEISDGLKDIVKLFGVDIPLIL